jgi:hypothetical protein
MNDDPVDSEQWDEYDSSPYPVDSEQWDEYDSSPYPVDSEQWEDWDSGWSKAEYEDLTQDQ